MACQPLHSAQTVADGIHIIHAFEYANAAARTGATGLVPEDIGKVARQLDNDSFWILTDDSPVTWVELAIPGGGTPGAHAITHENGGGDEMSVAGLSGLLADDQNPVNHAIDHQHSGADEIATATAAANAIPKADGTGKLNEAWIPTLTDSRYILVDAGRGSTVTTNLYLRHNQNIPSNLSGAVLPFDTTLIAIGISATAAATWTAEVHLGGSLVGGALLVSGGAKTAFTSALSIDFNAGDEVQFYCNGTAINRPHMIAVFRRR